MSAAAYHRAIDDARNQSLAIAGDTVGYFLRLLDDYAEEIESRVGTAFERQGDRVALEVAREIVADLIGSLESHTSGVIRLSADRVSRSIATATASLIESAGAGLSTQATFAPIGAQAAQAMLARPQLAATFRTIQYESIAAVDRILANAALRGVDGVTLGRQLRVHMLGADALPPSLLLDRRRIGYDAIRRLGYEATPENLALVRGYAGKIANRATLIGREEPISAELEAHRQGAEVSPVVLGIHWKLSHRHVVWDECDILAGTDFYGLGKGVYPAQHLPKRPHPRCLCLHVDRLRPPEEWGRPRPVPEIRLMPEDTDFGLSPSRQAALVRSMGRSVASHTEARPSIVVQTPTPPRPSSPARPVTRGTLLRRIRAREDLIFAEPHEWAAAFDPFNGAEVLFKTSHAPNFVRFSEAEIAQLAGTHFTHNHPRSTSFSAEDVMFASGVDVAEIRIASREYNYSLRRPDPGWPDWDEVTRPLYARFHQEVRAELRTLQMTGEITMRGADLRLNHEVWRRVWKELQLSSVYRRRRRVKP